MLLVMWSSLVGGGCVICESCEGVASLLSIVGDGVIDSIVLDPYFDVDEGSTCWITSCGHTYHGGDHNKFLQFIITDRKAWADWAAQRELRAHSATLGSTLIRGMSADYKETIMYMLIWLSWGYNGVTVFDSLDGVEIYKRTLSVEILHSEMLTMVDDERGLHYETHDGYVYVDGDKHLFMRHVEAARQQASTMAEWLTIQQDQRDERITWN